MKRFFFFFLLCSSLVAAFSEQKVGLALSGGGARGLAHVGMLKVLDELEIQIDYIAGTSIGSVIGGLYAMGYSADEIEDLILSLNWTNVISSKIQRQHLSISEKRWLPFANYYFDLNEDFIPTLPRAFLFGNSLINTFFDITYSERYIEHFDELPIPFRAVTTNIVTGEMTVIEDWKLHEAMRASMSFPTIFQPFEKDDCLFIDGGIRGNLPASVVKKMGADFVIGSQSSSRLKAEAKLQTIIDVLDQTINIGINDNVDDDLQRCDFVIEPFFEDVHLLDFHKIEEIINIGENAARKHIDELNKLPKRIQTLERKQEDEKINFSAIRVEGNRYLSNSKIREFIGLQTGVFYDKNDISLAFKKAYHSSLFSLIYPTLHREKDKTYLIVHVIEKPRNRLAPGFVYRNDNEMNVSLTLEMNNFFQRNSKMIANVKLGAENELNLDYVKNFGRHWGVYFRIFPNIREYRLYSYDDEHKRSSSVRSLEYGSVLGVGAFADQAIVMEFYGYANQLKLYQDIGEFETTNFTSSGAGIKFYHESLNHILFPTSGAQGILKFSLNRRGLYEEDWIRKMYSKIRLVVPFSSSFVSEYQFEYGSYFKPSEFADYNPFYIGGINSFIGLELREKSAPIFKVNAFHLRYRIAKNTFAKMTFNVLQLGDSDNWNFFESDVMYGMGLELAFDFAVLPLRFAYAINENRKSYFYLSFGYDFDPFKFSRN